MVDVPLALPVTRPEEDTVALVVSADVHVTPELRVCVVASVSVAVATSWSVSPAGKELLLVMAILVTTGAAVVIEADPVTAVVEPVGVKLAVTVALPAFLPVAVTPLTASVVVSDELHVTVEEMSLFVPSL
jgi:hypothetical protein